MSQRDKPRLALNNNTAGVREREETNRTGVAGHLDEIQGVVVHTRKTHRNGASLLAKAFGVGFIGWLDRTKFLLRIHFHNLGTNLIQVLVVNPEFVGCVRVLGLWIPRRPSTQSFFRLFFDNKLIFHTKAFEQLG